MKLFPSKNRFGKWIRWPLSLIPANSKMWVLSGPMRGNRWVAGSCNHGCWLGTYEKSKIQRYSELVSELPKQGVIYDVGAHAGIYSLVAAISAPTSVIHAFEPVPKNLEYLNEHLKLNQALNVVVHPVAIGRVSKMTFFALGHSSTTGRVSENGDIPIQQIQIDEEVKAGRLPPPQFIKMDIEGAEWEALLGAKDTLQKFHPQIFLATHGADVHRQCLNLLNEIGYKIFSLTSEPLAKTNEVYASWETTTAVSKK